MFKIGDEVVAIKRTYYDATKTGERYLYTDEMRQFAETQKVLTVICFRKKDGYVGTGLYNFHCSDLELYQPNLENV